MKVMSIEYVVIKPGDTVYHKPTGERWVVSFVQDGRLSWIGWPEGYADLSDCVLIESCSFEESFNIIRYLAEHGKDGDGRTRYAKSLMECETVRPMHYRLVHEL